MIIVLTEYEAYYATSVIAALVCLKITLIFLDVLRVTWKKENMPTSHEVRQAADHLYHTRSRVLASLSMEQVNHLQASIDILTTLADKLFDEEVEARLADDGNPHHA